MTNRLILKRASLNRSSGEWSDDDYDVVWEGKTVGRIFREGGGNKERPWFWSLAYVHHQDRLPMHGHEPDREAAMRAFTKKDGVGWGGI